jgi:L-fuconolactonase
MTAVIADSHMHCFSRGFPGAGGRAILGADRDIDAYENLIRLHGIAAALVVGYEADGIDPDNNRYIRELAETRPWMATLAYVPVSPAPDPGLIGGFLDAGHSGIALYATDAERAAAVAAWPREAWRRLAERSGVVSINARPPAMAALGEIVRREEGVGFVFSHVGLPGRYPVAPPVAEARERIAGLLSLAGRANAFVKISGLYAISEPAFAWPHASAAPFIDLVLDGFGPAHCVWGSDFCVVLEYDSFSQALSNPFLDRLAPAERAAVMGGSLLRLLKREAP